MTSLLNKAIEAIEKKEFHPVSDYDKIKAYLECCDLLRSLLPAEKEQRKEDMRRAYMASRSKVFPDLLDKQFETWYNEKYKK